MGLETLLVMICFAFTKKTLSGVQLSRVKFLYAAYNNYVKQNKPLQSSISSYQIKYTSCIF